MEENKTKQAPYLALLGLAWRHAREERSRFLLAYLMLFGSNFLLALEPVLWGWYIGELQQRSRDALEATAYFLGAYLLLHLGSKGLNGPARVVERDLAYRIGRNYLDELFQQALHLPVAWHQDHHSGATISRLRRAFDSLRYFFERGSMYLQSLVRLVFSAAAMIYFSPLYGLLAVAMGIGTIGLIRVFDKPFIASMRQVQEREHHLSSGLFDSLSNILTVITLRLQRRIHAGVLERVSAIFPVFHRHVAINEWKWLVVGLCISLIYAVSIGGYVWQQYQPGAPFLIGGLVTLAAYVGQFNSVFNNIAWQYNEIVRYHTEIETAGVISGAYTGLGPADHSPTLPAGWRQLEIHGLNFTYSGLDQRKGPTLQHIQLRLERGRRVALIGASGSGKSSLLALLRGLFPADPGLELRVDGQVFADLKSVHDSATLIPQEPEIFEHTIGYNLTLGLPVSPEEVQQACAAARFEEVIALLPRGLESHIQEKGVNLSGGQKQRLALARGILAARDSSLVLLDEPTSSIDPQNELAIYENLFREFQDKAVVCALHRLHLLPLFDYIYVLDQGRIVKQGRLEEIGVIVHGL